MTGKRWGNVWQFGAGRSSRRAHVGARAHGLTGSRAHFGAWEATGNVPSSEFLAARNSRGNRLQIGGMGGTRQPPPSLKRTISSIVFCSFSSSGSETIACPYLPYGPIDASGDTGYLISSKEK